MTAGPKLHPHSQMLINKTPRARLEAALPWWVFSHRSALYAEFNFSGCHLDTDVTHQKFRVKIKAHLRKENKIVFMAFNFSPSKITQVNLTSLASSISLPALNF